MTMSDPLGDMLTRIRNGQRARMAVVASPASKHRANVLEALKRAYEANKLIENLDSTEICTGQSEQDCTLLLSLLKLGLPPRSIRSTSVLTKKPISGPSSGRMRPAIGVATARSSSPV